jgi:hypothetical protein
MEYQSSNLEDWQELLSKEQEIMHSFVKKHFISGNLVKKTTVHQLRKFISATFYVLYGVREKHKLLKIKNAWSIPPSSWPKNVPFVNPENDISINEKKPRKNILVAMATHLCHVYQCREDEAKQNLNVLCDVIASNTF